MIPKYNYSNSKVPARARVLETGPANALAGAATGKHAVPSVA